MVKKNEVYTIDITGMTHEGQGVGRIDNFTVFVDGPIEGEKVEIKIIKVKTSYAIGKLLKVLEPSAARTEPFCPSYKRCGGCSLQHMNYEAGLKFKTDIVRENIRRIGGLEGVVVHDAIGMEQPLNYRNKAQYPVGRYKDGVRAGFYAKKTHEIIDCSTCGIQHSVSDRVRDIAREFIEENGISTYDEITGEGLVRHIMTRVGFKTGEVMVVLVINGRSIPGQKKLSEKLVKEIPEIKSIVLNVNTKKTNVILGDENIVVYGRETITDYIGDFKFNISPLSFFQVNPIQTEVLYNKALEYAQLTGKETVFDLYCGIGTISLFLSQKAKKVYGVEVVEAAINDAKENAKANRVENAEFIVGEAEKVIPEMYARGVRADVVVVDPPRKGCDEAVLRTLVDMKPERIVYVSCNPATLARDLKYLAEGGFEVREVQPVDMFPWTYHVETVCLMSRK
ncbi:MAG TPA: 23S rRNA (uracil(1939)-C(5))-methyltransferase RlmD [Acetivibrio sp.]|uniref:23S rRNA (uracil(1939)-C(5))-methyltransferase RlmD n=1 Tax=Acetivibrio sp. TaxID=1872092 RepID=UPI002BA1F3B4|nr:23S rRNA (uracil(1939)-C(5))-methyltransferase RlmD [Acetivibrio sp.]HOM01468.1 23S rRNA (uracil(1939)-C(5))-methyltransferase RlmD [Acetivibrio sp.]